MYEKLLALLTAKFAKARKDGLQQMARSLALHAADETESQALVDRIEESQVTNYIKDWRKEVDSEISKGTKSFEDNLKGKYDLVEKKTPSTPSGNTDDSVEGQVAKAVAEALQPLQDKLTQFESGRTMETRKKTLMGKLENVPEVFKNTILKNFDKMNFDSQEDFDSFIEETETSGKTIEQELANKGLGGFPHPANASATKNGEAVASDIKGWAEAKKE